jgi:predicted transcriptional regulator
MPRKRLLYQHMEPITIRDRMKVKTRIETFLRSYKGQCFTCKEISEVLQINRRTAHWNLQQLKRENKLKKKYLIGDM